MGGVEVVTKEHKGRTLYLSNFEDSLQAHVALLVTKFLREVRHHRFYCCCYYEITPWNLKEQFFIFAIALSYPPKVLNYVKDKAERLNDFPFAKMRKKIENLNVRLPNLSCIHALTLDISLALPSSQNQLFSHPTRVLVQGSNPALRNAYLVELNDARLCPTYQVSTSTDRTNQMHQEGPIIRNTVLLVHLRGDPILTFELKFFKFHDLIVLVAFIFDSVHQTVPVQNIIFFVLIMINQPITGRNNAGNPPSHQVRHGAVSATLVA